MRGMTLLSAVCSLALVSPAAIAQEGGGGGGGGGREGGGRFQGGQFGPQLTEEERAAAWELEVKAFAAGQNIDDETTTKLVEIYSERRAEHAEAMNELREQIREQMRQRMEEGGGVGGGGGGEGGGGGAGGGAGGAGGGGGERGFGGAGREMQTQLETVNEEHRTALATSLDEVLDGEQLEKATDLLGIFDTRWDGIVHTIAGFNLGEEQTLVALWPVETYVIAVRDARREAGEDFRAAQPKIQEARDALKKELEGILSTDQIAQLERYINPGRGQGGGGAPGGPGGGGGGF